MRIESLKRKRRKAFLCVYHESDIKNNQKINDNEQMIREVERNVKE